MECQPKLCKKTQLFCIASHVLKVMLLWKAARHSYLTTSSFISCSSFYISSLSSFLQIFRTFFTIIWKKIFITNFPFLTDSLKRPLLPDLNPLKRDKSLCWCSLNYFDTFCLVILWIFQDMFQNFESQHK